MKFKQALLGFLLIGLMFQSEFVLSFESGKAGFSVSVDGLRVPYNVFAFPVLPGQALSVDAPAIVEAKANAGQLKKESAKRWRWQAPTQPGLYHLDFSRPDGAQIRLNLFVMRLLTEVRENRLDGYMIGQYPQQAYKGFAVYEPPEGLVEVPREVLNVQLSPHFQLRQFLCKQLAVNRKEFMLFRPELLLKLETILQKINERGIAADTLFIMSGYRTPHYNKGLGNSMYSRHIYGGAADFFIDVAPKDGRMDDLNKDGVIDRKDASFLYSLVEGMSLADEWLTGGLGEYGVTSSHGPFVHVDVRGHRARWGRVTR